MIRNKEMKTLFIEHIVAYQEILRIDTNIIEINENSVGLPTES